MPRPGDRSALTRGPASRRRSGGGAGKVLLALVAALVVLGFGGGAYWLWQKNRAEAVDAVTLCPPGGPKAALGVLLDLTDPLTPLQQRQVRNRVEALVEAAEPGTLLVLGVVSPDEALRAAPRLGICKPRSGAEASALYQNPRLVEERFRTGFAEPFAAELDALLSLEPARSSPVMESLQSMLAVGMARLPAGVPAKVVIVSDLLQHSEAFSFYRKGTWASFSASPAAGRLGENLRGMDVLLLQLPRPDSPAARNPEVLTFWGSYFEREGAASVSREMIGDL